MNYSDAQMVFRRVEVTAVDDSGEDLLVTFIGLEGEEWKLNLTGQGHGLAEVPVVGAIGTMMAPPGRPDLAIVIGMRSPDLRPNGQQQGEATLYGRAGNKVQLDADGNVMIRPGAGGIVHINPP